MKLNISIDEGLVKRLEAYAEKNYMTKSGLVSVALVHYLNTQDALEAMRQLSSALARVADTGKLTDADRQSIENFERLAKMIM